MIVDASGFCERYSQRRINQIVEIHHLTVAVKKHMKKGMCAHSRRIERPGQLPRIVNRATVTTAGRATWVYRVPVPVEKGMRSAAGRGGVSRDLPRIVDGSADAEAAAQSTKLRP